MEAIRIDDTDALDRLRNGERAALAQIHIEHVKPVYWAAYRVLRSYSDADEIAQDVFLTLWRKRRSVRVYGTSLLPWLLTTAKYLALNRARARNRVATKEVELFDLDLVVEEDPLTHVAEEKQTADLRRAIEGLRSPDREIVVLCLSQGLTYQEAAVRLGLTHASVRSRLARARNQLRQNLDPSNVGE